MTKEARALMCPPTIAPSFSTLQIIHVLSSYNMTPDISCVSLGMLIVDEIRMPGKAPLRNVIGGSATFVTVGLRLFTSNSSEVGFLVLAGEDFPSSVEEELCGWNTTLVLKKAQNVPSSRGLLEYQDSTFGRVFHLVAGGISSSR
jgi:hypothetical protein